MVAPNVRRQLFNFNETQVLQSDRKIRAMFLLKFSKISISEIDDEIESAETSETDDGINDMPADTMTEELTLMKFELTAGDANIIYYISGAIGRLVVRCNKCEHCKEALLNSEAPETIHLDELKPDYTANIFLTVSIVKVWSSLPILPFCCSCIVGRCLKRFEAVSKL